MTGTICSRWRHGTTILRPKERVTRSSEPSELECAFPRHHIRFRPGQLSAASELIQGANKQKRARVPQVPPSRFALRFWAVQPCWAFPWFLFAPLSRANLSIRSFRPTLTSCRPEWSCQRVAPVLRSDRGLSACQSGRPGTPRGLPPCRGGRDTSS